jgi:transmembrane sensor
MTITREPQGDQDRIARQASEWIVLRSDRELTAEEEQSFSDWLAADWRHKRAHEALRQTWAEIPQHRDLAELVPMEGTKSSLQRRASPFSRFPLARPAFVSGVAAAGAAMLAFIVAPGLLTGSSTRYATQVGQMRRVALPDGSLVTLGPKSELVVEFKGAERRVALREGEAFFDIVHNAARPFLVEAGPSLVRVLGTKFDVNNSSQSVRVAVQQGVVELHDRRTLQGTQPTEILRASEQAELLITPKAAVPAANVQMHTSAATAPGAWREGRLIYKNVRLADLFGDVNRYYAPGVRLADKGAGENRITASFKTSEIPAFISALPAVIPIRADKKSDGSFQIESAKP